jgi:vacuolar-type H+-ATPase subunit E/Vma4
MTVRLSAEAAAALDPVRAALLDRARADGDALLAAADAQAAAAVAAARAEAGAAVAEARARGEREAAVVRTAERARARREARAIVLRAQRTAYDELRRRSRAAAERLHTEPGYRALQDRLVAVARADLGTQAVIREDPDGGLVAEAPGRRVDLRLGTLAERAVDGLGPELAALWAP